MSYINIYDVLPKEIVEQIQEYVDGVKVYIPKKADNRKSWGSNTDTKQLVSSRNHQIRLEHQNGLTVSELAQKYFLAEKTIQKIVYSRVEVLFWLEKIERLIIHYPSIFLKIT